MKRLSLLLLFAMFLAACGGAAAPATPAPAQRPAEQKPAAAKPTEAPAIPAQPAPATSAPLATALPEFRPPQSGGVLTPPTAVLTPKNNPAGATVRQNLWYREVLTNTPPARYDHAFAFFFEIYTVMVYGGRSQSTLGDTWTYTPGRGWYRSLPQATPPPRFGAEAVYNVYRMHPLVFGGQSGTRFFNDVWEFKSPPDEWVKVQITGNGPRPRAGASIGIGTGLGEDDARYTDVLIVTHGHSNKDYFDDSFTLDLATNTWEEITPTSRPSKRTGQAGTFDARHGKFILFGGQDTSGKLLGDLWVLDPAERVWTEIEPSGERPSPRSGSAFAYGYGRMWLFGGDTANGLSSELWELDTTNYQWTLINSTSGPSARRDQKFVCAYSGDYCFLFGGQDANGNALNDLWEFTP